MCWRGVKTGQTEYDSDKDRAIHAALSDEIKRRNLTPYGGTPEEVARIVHEFHQSDSAQDTESAEDEK